MLDGVSQNYDIGAIFRFYDAFLLQQLVICDRKMELHKRKLVDAAQGTQHWVPWSERQHASEAVAEAKARGATQPTDAAVSAAASMKQRAWADFKAFI